MHTNNNCQCLPENLPSKKCGLLKTKNRLPRESLLNLFDPPKNYFELSQQFRVLFIVMAKEQSKAPASSKAEQTVRSFSKQWVSERQSLHIVIAKYADREIYLERRNACYCNDCFLIHSWIWWARFLRAHSRGIFSLQSDWLFILTLGLFRGKI